MRLHAPAHPPARRNGNHTSRDIRCRTAVREHEISPMRTHDPVPALKQQLAQELVARIGEWRQDYAADFLGTDAARVSNLRNGRLECFSLERLIRFITRDHGTVTLHVTWKSRWHKLRAQRRVPPHARREKPA
jgi:predicted XRE-type DNA-binding protein